MIMMMISKMMDSSMSKVNNSLTIYKLPLDMFKINLSEQGFQDLSNSKDTAFSVLLGSKSMVFPILQDMEIT